MTTASREGERGGRGGAAGALVSITQPVEREKRKSVTSIAIIKYSEEEEEEKITATPSAKRTKGEKISQPTTDKKRFNHAESHSLAFHAVHAYDGDGDASLTSK